MNAPNEEDLGFELPPPATTSRTRVLVVVGLVAAGGFAYGYIQHRKAVASIPTTSTDTRGSQVQVIKATALANDRALTLPGTVKALEETKIFPRASGYVKSWLVDIGDKVRVGQVLAEIEIPEVDQQLTQARAQLAQAKAAVAQMKAQRDYSAANTARYVTLGDQKLVSQSQVELTQSQAAVDQANLAAAESNVAAQEANVHRLSDLTQFSRVTAPFAGTVTSRTVDRGALVTEGNATPMFTIVATDPVRVFLDVPQSVAASITTGTEATVTAREYGGRAFKGKVTRAAGALDPALHTMTTEVQVPNPDGALISGMYVQAAITLSVPHHTLEIPATALYSDALGLRVATVDAAQKIHFVPITIERDTGATLQLGAGLTGTERILKIAIPSLIEGDQVDVAK